MSSVPLTFCLSRCPVIWFHFLTIAYTGRWYSTSGHWIRPKMIISGCTKWLQDLKKKIISREGLQKESKHSCCCPTGQQSCAELHKRGEEKKLSQRQDGRIHTDKREAEEASWLHSSPVLPQAKTLIKAKHLCKSWFLTVFLNLVMNRLLQWAGLQCCWTGGKKNHKDGKEKVANGDWKGKLSPIMEHHPKGTGRNGLAIQSLADPYHPQDVLLRAAGVVQFCDCSRARSSSPAFPSAGCYPSCCVKKSPKCWCRVRHLITNHQQNDRNKEGKCSNHVPTGTAWFLPLAPMALAIAPVSNESTKRSCLRWLWLHAGWKKKQGPGK